MQKAEPVSAGVIIIGNEILSGRTKDANLSYLAQIMNDHGVQVREARIIPDIGDHIIHTVNTYRHLHDYVVTTGGIGPTHDDITANSIAAAMGRQVVMHPEIVAMLKRRPASEEVMASRMLMARVPEGAELVPSSVGPPGFVIENVFVLAGVPQVMRSMAQSMVKMMKGGLSVQSRSIRTYLVESEIATPLGEIQHRYPQTDIGSYPFYQEGRYGTNVVMRSTDKATLDAMHQEIESMIAVLNERYGRDG